MKKPHPELPDRISIYRGDPYYWSYWKHVGVKLDGVVKFDCVEVCVSEGWVNQAYMVGNKKRTRRISGHIELYWR